MLTPRQSQALRFIAAHQEQHGYSPTFEQIALALRLGSKSGVHRLIEALEGRGFIRRRANRARAIEILRSPDGPAAAGEITAVRVERDAAGTTLILGLGNAEARYRVSDGMRAAIRIALRSPDGPVAPAPRNSAVAA